MSVKRFYTTITLVVLMLMIAACGDAATPAPAQDEAGAPAADEEIIVGLITKTETNPFFVKMKEGAQAKADELGAQLLTAAGSFDGDNAAQVTAIENMVNAGAKGILITPSDTRAIVPAIQKARDAGVIVIALDTPTEPQDATDALFATDNFRAGLLIGQYAKAVMGDTPVKIATLDLAPGITVGTLRHNGFMAGYGLADVDASAAEDVITEEVVCSQDTAGDQAKGQTAMENCLTKDPDINLVYTINEPAAFGAYTAIKNAGRENDVLIVSVDGGCTGVEGVVSGQIGATSQQYPLQMATMGVEAVVDYARTGNAPSGYTDTGVTLITNTPVEGIESEGVVFGVESCWGDPSPGALDAAKAAEAESGMTSSSGGDQAAAGGSDEDVIVGLITKTETNPFFVKMKEGAQAKADELGAQLLTAAGSFDGDNAAQLTAIENMINAGAQGILITPSDTRAIVPSIQKARDADVIVIALDTPTEPQDATDALFATDNFQAGLLIGQYAKAAMGDKTPVIATLDLAPGITVGTLRHNGFMAGYGLADVDASATEDVITEEVVCSQDTAGDQAKGQTAMENCLVANPDINLVYTINEPAAFGAYTAIKNAGKENDVLIVSVDGGCAGVRGVVDGQIAATSQQYPLQMATQGVEAVFNYVRTGEAPSGYTDTGVTLITDNPQAGIDSQDTVFGLENCWGE
jgi:fructose transport system substrate-binding protein